MRCAVDGVVDRLAHAHVGERAARGVDRDVDELERRRRGEQLPALGVLLPVARLALRDLEDVDVAALELGDRGARLGDDARLERVGLRARRPSSSRWARRAGSRRASTRRASTARCRPGARRSPSGTRSGTIDATGIASSLGKIANGSLSVTTTRGVVRRREARDRRGLPVGELLGAEDRVERPAAAAAHLRVEHALPAREHLPRDERRPVGEGDAAAQVERVGQPVGRDVPARRRAPGPPARRG